MNKALRGLVFVILALSIGSLVFAILLFNKRELLKGRNKALEEQVIKLAKTIEEKDPDEIAPPEVQKDISEVTDRELANPEKQSMLENYPIKLEQQNLATHDLGVTAKRIQLRTYYQITVDAEGKPHYVLDPVDQKPMTTGPGTMNELLDKVVDRAKIQQAALNKTRGELTKMREAMTQAVEEINKLKLDGRTTKRILTETRERVAQLENEKAELERQIARLKSEKAELEAELADARGEIEKLNEDKLALNDELVRAKETIEEMKKRLSGTKGKPIIDTTVAIAELTAGDKGTVVAVNNELNYVIIEFTPDAMDEMLGPERQNPLPQMIMNIRRKGRKSATGDFVTRIKLSQAVRGRNVVVADILPEWRQTPVEKGDVVFK